MLLKGGYSGKKGKSSIHLQSYGECHREFNNFAEFRKRVCIIPTEYYHREFEK